MRKIRVILSFVVVLGAFVAAFANSVTVSSVRIHIRFSGQLTFICVNTDFFCDEISAYLCRVFIPDLNATTEAYRSAACVIPHYHSSPESVGAYIGPVPIIDAD